MIGRPRLLSLLLPLLFLGGCEPPGGAEAQPVRLGAQEIMPATASASTEVAPAAPATSPSSDPGASMAEPARLDWSMALEAGGLRIRYTVTSTSKDTIYLSDQMPVPGKTSFVLGETFINVAGGDAPGTVRFVRGRLTSVAPVPIPLDPGARALKAGQTLTGEALVPMPIQSAHYHGMAAPLNGTPTSATLEIGYVMGEAHWTELALEDGGKITITMPMDEMRTLRTAAKPIPTF